MDMENERGNINVKSPLPHIMHTHKHMKIKFTITNGEFSDKLAIDITL